MLHYFKRPHLLKKLLIIIVILVVIFFWPTKNLLAQVSKTRQLATETFDAVKTQDLAKAGQKIEETKKQVEKTKGALRLFVPFKFIPFLGSYYSDGQHILNAATYGLETGSETVKALEPYADILGLQGKGTFSGGTAEQRIQTVVQTLDKITPSLDKINENLKKTRAEIDEVNPNRYPPIFVLGKVRKSLKQGRETVDQIESFFVDAKPLIEVLPELLGSKEEKRYLLIFQNDAELRPTGGFMTAYSIFKVDKGKMTPEVSDDIYQLDKTKRKRYKAPDPILKYHLNVSELHLRDSNLSPDFLQSMKAFEAIYQELGAYRKVDGIIGIDTKFLLKMMDVLGPIPAYGTTFTTKEVEACGCPQVIWELENAVGQPLPYFIEGGRKDIIGVLMNAILQQALQSSPSQKWPSIFGTIITSMREKHILLYLYDQKAQEAAEKVNFAGRIKDFDGDYLHINEANMAGAKSNLYIKEEIKHLVEISKDGMVKKTITINYKYPRGADNCNLERKEGLCLAGIYRDWIRFYVPKGSKLVKFEGSEKEVVTYEDLGKTVFEGFLTVRPKGSAQVKITYEIPQKFKKGEMYKLVIQKEPGTDKIKHELEVKGKKKETFELQTDREFSIKL